MKLQNLSVIFIIIVLPLLLIVSYYISLQIDTINMQTAYNSKILDSTKEAIDAFEINTVEWNANYSETADSKRRDVMASINTFLTSFANNTGVAGTSKDFMLSRIPAIAYTLYDGYYIYSPAETQIAVKDGNGVALYISEKLCDTKYSGGIKAIQGYTYKEEDKGKLLYRVAHGKSSMGTYRTQTGDTIPFTLEIEDAQTEYKHILKPFTAYSEQLTEDIVINYTLDNYITLYGKMRDSDGVEKYMSKSGYLSASTECTNNTINGTKFNEKEIKPEILKERIAYTDDETNYSEGEFVYAYEYEGNTKVYYDGSKWFRLNSDLKRVEVTDKTPLYKKCTVPRFKGGSRTYETYYQNLYDGKWYQKNNLDEYIECTNYATYGLLADTRYDYSAINYCVESALFTAWINSLDLPEFLQISSANNPDPAINNGISAFEDRKRETLKNVLESNLNQAITSYSRNSEGTEFYLPKLNETDWDQLLRNASIITFVQNIPIGMKYYNNYAIATSTVNKEYVDPNEIYLYNENKSSDQYYHMPYCNEYTNSNLIGYRSIDFIQKNYVSEDETGEDKTKYYYRHSGDVSQGCYNCIVQKSSYNEEGRSSEKEKAYYTALARERFVARMTKLPSELEAEVYINIKAYEGEGADEKLASPVSYTVTTPDGEQTYLEATAIIPVKKDITNYTYTIKTQNAEEAITATSDFESIHNTMESVTPHGTYYSDSEVKIRVIAYNNNNIIYEVEDKEDVVWGTGYSDNLYDEYESNPVQLSVEDDAYINIKLKYQQNYQSSSGQINSVWAEIEEYNKLIVKTTVTGVSGYIRLKFTNGTKTLYSEEIFNITDPNIDTIIKCKIDGINGTDWYSGDWKVAIVATDCTTSITDMPVGIEYYGIGTKTGLIDFAAAVNGTTDAEGSAITEGRRFKLISDITSVGEMEPIAGELKDDDSNGVNDIWFNGTFEGQNKTISGVEIDSSTANAFGLFGWVGKTAIIKDLTIDNISIDVDAIKGDCKIGGLAAFADEGQYIENIKVKGSTIKGTTFVGGIVGENKKKLDNCIFEASTVLSQGETKTGGTAIYIGGIAGKSNNEIINSSVISNSYVGNGNVTMKNKERKY